MSRNPFRQARDNNEEIKVLKDPAATSIFDSLSDRAESPASVHNDTAPTKVKKKKKVVIKTPPRSPEEPKRKLSLGRAPSPPIEQGLSANDDGDSTGSVDVELEQAIVNTRRNSDGSAPIQEDQASGASIIRAPLNPFAKTLATSEERYQEESILEQQHGKSQQQTENKKPAFDVETFKDILMNGTAPPPRAASDHVDRAPESASQDTPETHFTSRFPAIDDNVPREVTTIEDSSDSSDGELASTAAMQYSARIDGQMVSQMEDRNISEASVGPPPPPTRRKATPKESAGSHHRSSSVISKSSVQSEPQVLETPFKASEQSGAAPPPPPPSRRVLQARPVSTALSANSSETSLPSTSEKHPMSPPPAPAPRRTPVKTTPVHRTPSSASRSSLQAVNEAPSAAVGAPRPPPPRRKADSNRSSIDGLPASRRTSGQDSRRPSNEPDSSVATEISQDTLLSDLAALQREVDALRAKAGG